MVEIFDHDPLAEALKDFLGFSISANSGPDIRLLL